MMIDESPDFDEENQESFGRGKGIIGTAVDIAGQKLKREIRHSLFEEACNFVDSFFGSNEDE